MKGPPSCPSLGVVSTLQVLTPPSPILQADLTNTVPPSVGRPRLSLCVPGPGPGPAGGAGCAGCLGPVFGFLSLTQPLGKVQQALLSAGKEGDLKGLGMVGTTGDPGKAVRSERMGGTGAEVLWARFSV